MKKIIAVAALIIGIVGFIGGTNGWAFSETDSTVNKQTDVKLEPEGVTPPEGGPAYLYNNEGEKKEEPHTHMPKDVPVTVYDKNDNILWEGTQEELMKNKDEINEIIKKKNNGNSPFE